MLAPSLSNIVIVLPAVVMRLLALLMSWSIISMEQYVEDASGFAGRGHYNKVALLLRWLLHCIIGIILILTHSMIFKDNLITYVHYTLVPAE